MKKHELTEEDRRIWEEYIRDIPKKSPRRRMAHKHGESYPATLDLHGFTLQEGFDILRTFIGTHFTLQTRTVIVITGKGPAEQSFMHKVPRWLRERHFTGYISSFTGAPPDMGGEGALIVRIKRRGK